MKLNWFRIFWPWAFLLASIAAQVPHAHDTARAPVRSIDLSNWCDESRPHWTDHSTGPGHAPASDCPVCQFRGMTWVVEPIATFQSTETASPTLPARRPVSVQRQIRSTRCRAPPLV